MELKDGKWICDCFPLRPERRLLRAHLRRPAYQKSQSQLRDRDSPSDESSLKCRYCGSPDISRCGFRYNARGISRRYYCHECERKFSIRIVESEQAIANVPSEVVWLLDEVGLQVSKLNDFLLGWMQNSLRSRPNPRMITFKSSDHFRFVLMRSRT